MAQLRARSDFDASHAAIALLTLAGLLGAAVDALAGLPATGGPHGCAAGMLVLLVIGAAAVYFAVWLAVVAVATLGIVLLTRRSRWGPILLLISNLSVMWWFGYWPPVGP